MDDRLPARLEASSLVRRAEGEGGNGMIVARGDPDRGALVLLIMHRGAHIACLERQLGPDGRYDWAQVGPAAGASEAEVGEWAQKRRRFDSDSWLIELNVPQPERFIAETTAIG
jgi:hypothetical protein